MPSLAAAYKGPAVVVGVGGGFALVGMVPVAITMTLGIKSSATIIGVGFMGFGFLLILPGVCWCLILQRKRYVRWRDRRCHGVRSKQEHTPALGGSLPQTYGCTNGEEKKALQEDYNGPEERLPLQKDYDEANEAYESKEFDSKETLNR